LHARCPVADRYGQRFRRPGRVGHPRPAPRGWSSRHDQRSISRSRVTGVANHRPVHAGGCGGRNSGSETSRCRSSAGLNSPSGAVTPRGDPMRSKGGPVRFRRWRTAGNPRVRRSSGRRSPPCHCLHGDPWWFPEQPDPSRTFPCNRRPDTSAAQDPAVWQPQPRAGRNYDAGGCGVGVITAIRRSSRIASNAAGGTLCLPPDLSRTSFRQARVERRPRRL